MYQKAGEAVAVADYDPLWPLLFDYFAAGLRGELGNVALRIDHIGSTAVPCLAAKPVIDIQISVAAFEPLDAFRLPLENLGYIYRADNPELTKRYFREKPGQRRTHIHVRRAGSFSEQFALLFRDYLRAHADVAAQYGALKKELAAKYSQPRERHFYTEAKQPFIWRVMAQADEWAQQTGWEPGPSDG